MAAFRARRQAFKRIRQRVLNLRPKPVREFERLTCAACGYPTQYVNMSHETCPVCDWGNEGQDDPHENESWGGMNALRSLAEARRNFGEYGTILCPSDGEDFVRVRARSDQKRELVDLYDTLLQAEEDDALRKLIERIREVEPWPDYGRWAHRFVQRRAPPRKWQDMSEDKSRFIGPLFCFADDLKSGRPCQITRLMPINRLASDEQSCRTYYLYLVRRTMELFAMGASLSTVRLVSDEKKKEFISNAIDLLELFYSSNGETDVVISNLYALHDQIESISPGIKRIWINASRRKLEDPDLLLVEAAIWFSAEHCYKGYFAYLLSQYFVCDYARLRFIIDSRSAERVEDLARFWSRFYGG